MSVQINRWLPPSIHTYFLVKTFSQRTYCKYIFICFGECLIGQEGNPHYIKRRRSLLNCLCSTSRPSRKTKVSHWLIRKIASLRLRPRPGQSMFHQSCQRLSRGPADAERRKRGVPVRNDLLPVLKSSKSWMKSLERLKGRRQGQRTARKRERAKKFHCPQTGKRVKATMRTGSTAQKVEDYK